MIIHAIDPAPEKSAVVSMLNGLPWFCSFVKNANLYRSDNGLGIPDIIVCEDIRSYGLPVGASTFETAKWIGCFRERARVAGIPFRLIGRKDVLKWLHVTAKGSDAKVRAKMIQRFGGTEKIAIGTKAAPGPLYGIVKDLWSALAIAVVWAEREKVGMNPRVEIEIEIEETKET